MRPIKLTMSAFGSYSGMETIDFTKIQGGLFLVTGDTGAGKTTIFDAVTYALYDRTSGGRRDGNMMRSQYADDEAETFVEYTFAYRDGQYTIRRNPEYMRAGKRKNADGKIRLVKETSKVSLIMPDGKEFQGKKREVDQKIEQIIGLDAGQFTQIAMIAQGDFLRLLHAESKERKKIFSKIFQTQIYRDVQEQLKEQGKALYIQLKENEADIRREMERVDADGSKVQKVWEDLISQEMPSAEAVTETLGRILKEGKEAYETMEAEETALRKESEQLHLMIGKKEEINRIFGLLERTESEYKRLQEQSAEYELLKNHALLGERSEQARRLEVQALRTKEDARRIKEEIVTLNEWMEEHSKRENRLKEDAEQAESEMDRIEPKLREQIVRLREILPRYAKVRKLKAEYEKQTVQMTRCIDQCKAASEDYEEKYRIFFGEQAGILAQELKEGSPCPVCGSVHHPHKAKISEGGVDEKTVEEAKKIRDEAERKRAAAQEKYQEVRAQFETEEKALFGERYSREDEKQAEDRLAEYESLLAQKRSNLKKLQDAYRKTAEENQRQAGRAENLVLQKTELEERFEQEQEMFRQEIRKQRFADQEEYREAKKWIEGWRQMNDQVKTYESLVVQKKSSVETLKGQLNGKRRQETESDVRKKNETDMLTLQVRGDGPLGGITVTADSKGDVKGYVNNPDVMLPPKNGKLDVGGAVGIGLLQVIKDMGLKEPYSGQTILVSSEIAEDLTYYFANSEQVPSSVGLGVLMEKDNTVECAGGFIIQMMPFAKEETISQIEENLKNITSVTDHLKKGETPEQILEILLGNLGLEITDTMPTRFYCNCSKERVEKAVISVGKKEIQDMIDEGKDIEVKCHFCNTAYKYTVDELKDILKRCKR